MKLLVAAAIVAVAIVGHALISRHRYEAHVVSAGAFLLLDKKSGISRVCLIESITGQVQGCSIGYHSAQN